MPLRKIGIQFNTVCNRFLSPGATGSTGAEHEPVKEDVAYWGYTWGSTGRPKAAIHAHQDFAYASELVGMRVFGLESEDLVFSASKLYFAFGLGNLLYFPARVGAASVLCPERIEADRAFDVVARERPTVFPAVPTVTPACCAWRTPPSATISPLCVSVSPRVRRCRRRSSTPGRPASATS
jgi:acyl-coenzyme A synthetase/AMP-(fatty) acid ligase